MPAPRLLMEMKIRSLPGRTQDDKRTKDLIDLCGLLLYSGVRPPPLSRSRDGSRLLEDYERAVKKTKSEEWDRVAASLEVTASAARRAARMIL